MAMIQRTVWSDFKAAANNHLQGVEWSLNGTLAMLWRRWPLVLAVCAACVALAALWLAITPSRYTAQTMLQLNTRQEQVTNFEDVMSGLGTGDAAIRTEVDMLKSRKIAQRVIEDMDLLGKLSSRRGLKARLLGLGRAFLFPLDESPSPADDHAARMTRAIDAFLARLEVVQVPRSYSIIVKFTSTDPKMAANVANAVAEAYLTSQLEDKFDATKRANTWMNNRLKQLQKSVQQAELAVRKFREENDLTQAHGVTLSEQQLSELNSQLILARTQLAEAEARRSAAARGVSTASEVLNSPLIQNLRIQETEVRRKISDLGSRYGARHPRMQTARQELADVQGKIAEETAKIRGSLDNGLATAQARVETLQQQLDQMQSQNKLSTSAEVQLAELERQAQAERSLYQAFLARSREIAQMDFVQTDARVIYPAEVPLNPSHPKKTLIMMLALIAGGLLGMATAIVLETMDSGFRTGQQLESMTGLRVLGLLGELPTTLKDRARYVLHKPTSAYAEGIRSIRTALRFAETSTEPPRVVAITSSVPQEGKSLFSIGLAQLAAASGQKVLLIDADLRKPSLAKQLGHARAKAGLAEVLSGKASLKDIILTEKDSGLSLIPARGDSATAQELLGGAKMAELMQGFRKQYDLVVIDCPPVMAVADALTVSPLADALLYVVRWGGTPRPLVQAALKQLHGSRIPVTGAVLSRVDLEKQLGYGHGDFGFYYGKYKDYYTN